MDAAYRDWGRSRGQQVGSRKRNPTTISTAAKTSSVTIISAHHTRTSALHRRGASPRPFQNPSDAMLRVPPNRPRNCNHGGVLPLGWSSCTGDGRHTTPSPPQTSSPRPTKRRHLVRISAASHAAGRERIRASTGHGKVRVRQKPDSTARK